jgi:hypothetical protein
MKAILIFTFLLFQLSADAQIYIQLKEVKGAATLEATAKNLTLTPEQIHARSLEWIKQTFLSEDVITQNIPERISALFSRDYSNGSAMATFEHNLSIDIKGDMVLFTVSDTKIGLLRSDGTWKEHLAKMRVMYEEMANELFWSYEAALKETPKK